MQLRSKSLARSKQNEGLAPRTHHQDNNSASLRQVTLRNETAGIISLGKHRQKRPGEAMRQVWKTDRHTIAHTYSQRQSRRKTFYSNKKQCFHILEWAADRKF